MNVPTEPDKHSSHLFAWLCLLPLLPALEIDSVGRSHLLRTILTPSLSCSIWSHILCSTPSAWHHHPASLFKEMGPGPALAPGQTSSLGSSLPKYFGQGKINFQIIYWARFSTLAVRILLFCLDMTRFCGPANHIMMSWQTALLSYSSESWNKNWERPYKNISCVDIFGIVLSLFIFFKQRIANMLCTEYIRWAEVWWNESTHWEHLTALSGIFLTGSHEVHTLFKKKKKGEWIKWICSQMLKNKSQR